jgi:hypothetical protein
MICGSTRAPTEATAELFKKDLLLELDIIVGLKGLKSLKSLRSLKC